MRLARGTALPMTVARLLLVPGTAGREEWREKVVGNSSSSLWNSDRDFHSIGRFGNGEPQERAALGFLSHQLVNAVTHGRGIVELERHDVSSMGAQPVSIQLRDPRHALLIVVAAQRARDGRFVLLRHADPLACFTLRRPCPKCSCMDAGYLAARHLSDVRAKVRELKALERSLVLTHPGPIERLEPAAGSTPAAAREPFRQLPVGSPMLNPSFASCSCKYLKRWY